MLAALPVLIFWWLFLNTGSGYLISIDYLCGLFNFSGLYLKPDKILKYGLYSILLSLDKVCFLPENLVLHVRFYIGIFPPGYGNFF